MPTRLLVLAALAIVANLLGFALMLVDKRRARTPGARRVRERTLFLVALFGGALGSWAGMYAVRHKTRHAAFVVGIPALVLLQGAGLVWWWLG